MPSKPKRESRIIVTTTRAELLTNGTDHQFRALLYDFDHLSSLLGAARAHLAAQIDLSPPQYNMLMVMAEDDAPEGISLGDLAQRLHVSGAFATTETNKLVEAGYITKRPNPLDGRGILLNLTPLARKQLTSIAKRISSLNDNFFHSLTPDDFDRLGKMIATLIRDGKTALREAVPPGKLIARSRRRADPSRQ